MSTETAASAAPEPTAGTRSKVPQVDLAAFDEKHLSQYRHPNEHRALVVIAAGMVAFLIALWLARPFLGNILELLPNPVLRFLVTWLEPTRLGLVVLGLLALAAVMDVIGQASRSMLLVAQAVEVTPTTFPQLAPIVDDLRTRFDLPRTRVYVSRDAPLTGYTIGVREPFAIVFSSIGIGSLTPDEFKFALGSEMGSIKLGHTVMASLLGNARMSLPQPFSFLLRFRSIIFGSYQHAQTLSCDRIGVVATRDVRPALSTLIKQNLGQVRGAKIDIKSLTPQTSELNRGVSGAILRASMVLSAKPFAVARLAELVAWTGEPAPTVSTTPAAPPLSTPAASATAAASANAAAESATAAAASAAAAAGSASLLAPSGMGASLPPIASTDPSADEPANAATAAESSRVSDALSPGEAVIAGPAQAAAPASPTAVAEAATATVAPPEASTATAAAATAAPRSEPLGTGALPPLPGAAASR